MTQQPIAQVKSGPELPVMFARYKSWVEEELCRSVPSAGSVSLYVLLQYHMGWADRWGIKPHLTFPKVKP